MRKDLPRVPISLFKANPARYLETGALVTNHGHARAAFLPLAQDRPTDLGLAKASLKVLYRVQPADEVVIELEELSAERERDRVSEPR